MEREEEEMGEWGAEQDWEREETIKRDIQREYKQLAYVFPGFLTTTFGGLQGRVNVYSQLRRKAGHMHSAFRQSAYNSFGKYLMCAVFMYGRRMLYIR